MQNYKVVIFGGVELCRTKEGKIELGSDQYVVYRRVYGAEERE